MVVDGKMFNIDIEVEELVEHVRQSVTRALQSLAYQKVHEYEVLRNACEG